MWDGRDSALGVPLRRLTLAPGSTGPFLFGGTGASFYSTDPRAIATPLAFGLTAEPTSAEVSAPATFRATVSGGDSSQRAFPEFGRDRLARRRDGAGLSPVHGWETVPLLAREAAATRRLFHVERP